MDAARAQRHPVEAELERAIPRELDVDGAWRHGGAGRADITIAGGDVPATLGSENADECWGADFARAYNTDTAGLASVEGDPTACEFGDP